jgi:hypothetical protein
MTPWPLSLLTHDAEGAENIAGVLQMDRFLSDADREASLKVFEALRKAPGSTQAELEQTLGPDTYAAAAMPSILAQARSEGLVTVGNPRTPDGRWELTEDGKTRLSKYETSLGQVAAVDQASS